MAQSRRKTSLGAQPATYRPVNSAYLKVKVTPGARRDEVVGRYGDTVKVRVAAPPEDGKANAAVLALIASALDVASGQIQVVHGKTQPRKTLRIDGAGQQAIDSWINSLA